MKKYIFIICALVALLFAGCDQIQKVKLKPNVYLPTGPVVLEDANFGVYYGNKNYDNVGIYGIVLTDARCYQDIDEPYLDSEGDLLALELRSHLIGEGKEILLPEGEYVVSDDSKKLMTINPANSYVKKFVGNTLYRWTIKEGTVVVKRANDGKYEISTDNLVIEKSGEQMTVQYTCNTNISLADYFSKAPSMVGQEDDLIDMPFSDMFCDYYGNIYGYGSGNFVVQMATKDLMEDETTYLPGVLITINIFSKLFEATETVKLPAGRYEVTPITSDKLFTEGSVMPGVLLDTQPFGSYVYQQVADDIPSLEFISSGYVDVSYSEEDPDYCTFVYNFKTSGRKISGLWRGNLEVRDYAEDADTSEPLSTLTDDVHCDMSKVKSGTIRHIETLHRNNTQEMLDYDIAEAWQLVLEPRDWTEYEYKSGWIADDDEEHIHAKGNYYADLGSFDSEGKWVWTPNGISDRIDHWCADGDVMFLEFILPLDCTGNICPKKDVEYVYQMQPNLPMDTGDYEACVSKMGRPDDTVFDPKCAGFGYSIFMNGNYDYCNGRRGFTWDGGFRGNWYLHYKKNNHQVQDGHAPAIHGTVKVTRTTNVTDNVATYSFTWELKDDRKSQNTITGSWTGPVTIIR